MGPTYSIVFRDGRLEWEGEAPSLPPGARLRATVVEPAPQKPLTPAVAVLEEIAAAGGPAASGFDFDEWDRERRADRPLPGRGE